jgi:hypothetical protein
MKLRIERLWRMVPVPIVSIDRMPGRLIGLSLGLLIVIRSDHAADRPTIVHELEHCKQFWKGGLLVHMLRYWSSRGYRLRAELEAFRAELAACDGAERAERLDDAARSLATGYHVGLDIHACRHLLTCSLPSEASWPTSQPAAERPPMSSPPVSARSTNATRR